MSFRWVVDEGHPNGYAVEMTAAEQAQFDADQAAASTRAAAAAAEAANYQTAASRCRAAITSNDTYLAVATPTTAQLTSQVTRLTRQCNGLSRMLLTMLGDVSDT